MIGTWRGEVRPRTKMGIQGQVIDRPERRGVGGMGRGRERERMM